MAHVGEASIHAVLVGGGTNTAPKFSVSSTPYLSGISFDSGTDTLSTYVQGTWTPTFVGSPGNPTVTYTSQVGTYTQVGNRVMFNANVAWSATSGGSGGAQIGGAPFTPNASNYDVGNVQIFNGSFNSASKNYVICRNFGNNSKEGLIQVVSNGAAVGLNVSTAWANTAGITASFIWGI
jgi:hypothetical protein